MLTTYGRSSGFCIDPIEKKPLNHFYPGSTVLSFGTAGCNLGCKFCQNWNISTANQMHTLASTASPQAIARAALTHKCKSVAFTYNDPVIFTEYADDIAVACRQKDIRTVAVTAGYITEQAREFFFSHMDGANVDLKSFSDDFYKKYCHGRLEPVKDTLLYLIKETNVWVEITTLLIPGANDSDGEIHALTEWVASSLGTDVPVHFTAFHPDYQVTNLPPTPPALLQKARDIAISKGIKFVYTGNVHDTTSGSTWCPVCSGLLIERNWHNIGQYNLTGSACNKCGYKIPGSFDNTQGRWDGNIRRIIP